MAYIINFSKSIDASTTKSTAITQLKAGTTGTLKKIFVHFPAGCDGKVHVQMIVNNYLVLPSNEDGDIVGDDERISFDMDLDILSSPADFTLKAWNTDDKAHVIDAQLVIEPFGKIGI